MMFDLLRLRRRTAEAVSFCDSCSEVCTPACRAAAHHDGARTQAMIWSAVYR